MALTKNIGSNLAAKYGYIQTYVAGEAIFRGALVVLRFTTADDKVYAAADDIDDSDKQLVLGFAMEAAVADAPIRVRQDGKFRLKFPGGVPSSVIGRLACIKSDEDVQLWSAGSTCKVVVGRITEKSTTQVFVDLGDRPARLATSLAD